MSRMYRGKRIGLASQDANHDQLVKVIVKMGATFCDTSSIEGALDGIVGFRRLDRRVEFKNSEQPPSKRRLTPAEQDTFDTWAGAKPHLIETEDDVIDLINSMGHDAEALSYGLRHMRD